MSREFSRLRSFFWPVHGYELKKLIPMLLMAFFITFNYNILRGVKDSVIVTAAGSGAEVIPFLKVWAMLPLAVVLASVYIKLSHRFSGEKVFYIMLTGFLAFFGIFTFVLYPLQDYIHPHGFADWLQTVLPQGLNGLVSMIRYWSFSLFYAMCELWGVICLSVLFWGFANEITKVGEATRFYGLFSIGCNVSAVAAGQAAVFLSSRAFNPNWIIGGTAWHQALILLTLAVLGSGVMVILIYTWLHRSIVAKMSPEEHGVNKQLAKLESKPSMRESFRHLMKSKYLISLAVVMIAYNMVINLVEVLWKDQVKLMHSSPTDYNIYMGHVTWITGVIATIMALFISGNVIRKFGWTTAALLTPVILIVTSIGFFGCYLFPNDSLGVITTLLGTTPLIMGAFFGSMQNVLSRGAKYTVFDATKELCFIPLNRESRVKGKAAIDGVSSRVGKSGGALIYQGLLMSCGSLARCAPYVAGILGLVLTGWVIAVKSLGRQFKVMAEGTNQTAVTPKPATESLGERQAV